MSDPTLCAEIIWKIEDFTSWPDLHLNSQKFVLNTLDKSLWQLSLQKESSGGSFFLVMMDNNGKRDMPAKIEITVLDCDNQLKQLKELTGRFIQTSSFLLLKIDNREVENLYRNVFTIRCRMWAVGNEHATHVTCVTATARGVSFYSQINSVLDKEKTSICQKSTLTKDAICMLRDGSMSDFSIQVRGRTIAVHTFILASRSPVFHRMLQTNMKEKKDKILKLDELDEDTVNQMLEYMYSDNPGELNTESALKLYSVGDQYQILGLKEVAALHFKQSMDLTNACDLFHLADQHNYEDLKGFATEFILSHEKEVVLSPEFETLSECNQNSLLKELTKLRLR